LLGIVGNDLHQETLVSLAQTGTSSSKSPSDVKRCARFLQIPTTGSTRFGRSRKRARDNASAPAIVGPADVTFEASMPNGRDVVEDMAGASVLSLERQFGDKDNSLVAGSIRWF
jgi:hypothetical protein